MLNDVAWSVADCMRMSHPRESKIRDASPSFQSERNDSGAVAQLKDIYAASASYNYVAEKHKRVSFEFNPVNDGSSQSIWFPRS